jgi:peptide chain release factor
MDAKGTMVVVTAGRGPKECEVAVCRVAAEMLREADAAGVSAAADLPADGTAASVSVSLGGEAALAFVRTWAGTVLWVDGDIRKGRSRKNWYVSVRVVDAPAAVPDLDPADVRIETMRAGGPGGQHQNTTDSAVRATHLPTGLSAMARDGRSQHRNRKIALDRLAELLASIGEREAEGARRREWLDRITVERGNPVRTYRGAAMERVG